MNVGSSVDNLNENRMASVGDNCEGRDKFNGCKSTAAQ